jgi:hypothetical protein
MSQVSPGWYPDPDGKPCDRYWNGSTWTLETRPRTSTNSISQPNVGMSSGWKIVIAISFVFAIALLVFLSSEPDIWST